MIDNFFRYELQHWQEERCKHVLTTEAQDPFRCASIHTLMEETKYSAVSKSPHSSLLIGPEGVRDDDDDDDDDVPKGSPSAAVARLSRYLTPDCFSCM